MESEWYASLRSGGAVLVQSFIALGLMLGTCLVAPRLTLLMMMTVVVVVSTGSLRLPGRATAVLLLGATGGLLFTLQWQTGPLLPPLDDWVQRLLAAVFVLWTIAKGASTSFVGAQWRLQLSDSHNRLAEALATVEELASVDALTGLPNRRSILASLDAEMERMHRSKVRFSVGMVDIDHFKRINDSHGHATGDAVLTAFGRIVHETLRDNDRLGRYGGEEFLLVLPGPVDAEGAHRLGERLRRRVQEHDWTALAPGLQVTASFGMAVAHHGESPPELLARSDRSLYEAKAAGRNRVVVAAPPTVDKPPGPPRSAER